MDSRLSNDPHRRIAVIYPATESHFAILWRHASAMVACGVLVLICLAMMACTPEADNSARDSGEAGPLGIQPLPGTQGVPMELAKQYEAMRIRKGTDYKPRTKHLDKTGWARFTNRLFLESSPYLLQHAHNPVNWYPWGDEAFETARQKNLPVLLSVGYSTCHWCHVMEEESFEDIEIATYLNANYIAVKVDREERPDVDAIYMSAVQAITGRGGWPMTVWLTPDRKPFYGGTYYPARDGDRGSPVGFLTLLRKVKESYDQKPDLVAQTSTQLANAVQRILTPEKGGTQPLEPVLQNAVAYAKAAYDKNNGGVTGAPKFPSTMPVRLLLRDYRRSRDASVLEMANNTLTKMATGGIYDQIGGGFHRYATDEIWLVPHFEKMLYDNALLVMAYLEGFQVSGNPLFKQVVEETLAYVKLEMTAPEGGFYSATDADSLTPAGDREEGYFFTWTPQELASVLGAEDAAVVARYYGVSDAGNFEGRNILNVRLPAATVAADLGITEDALRETIADAKLKLYAHRARRPAPFRDEKIITAWNGLMISAFARSGLLLDHPDYVRTAQNAAHFILENLYADQRLLRTYKDGQARHKAYLDDYAFFIAALLDLFEVDPDPLWFETALALNKILMDLYADSANGGFFMTADDHEDLIAREKPGYDGALPSGNAVAVMNLLRFAAFTTDDDFRKQATRAIAAFAAPLQSNPLGSSEMMLALDFELDGSKELVIATPEGKHPDKEPFLEAFRSEYLPNRVLIQVEQGQHAARLAKWMPLVKGKSPKNGKPVAYVCEKGVCQLPSFTADAFAEQIRDVHEP